MDNKQQKLTKALFKHKIGQGFCDGRLKEGGGDDSHFRLI